MRSEFKIADFKKVTNDFNFYILTHPSNLTVLEKAFKPEKTANQYYLETKFGSPLFYDYGIEIHTDPNLPRFVVKQEWKFPPVKFVEFDEVDIKWAEPIGFGHWVETQTNEPLLYKISKDFALDFSSVYKYPTIKTMVTNFA